MEVSLTQIFNHNLRGREFLEEINRDNLDFRRIHVHFPVVSSYVR